MNKTLTPFLLAASFVAMSLVGCIKEDFSDCPPDVIPPDTVPEDMKGALTLQLSYLMHNTVVNGEYADLFNDQVRKVDVFVFDDKGEYVQTVEEQADALFPEEFRHPLGVFKCTAERLRRKR